MTTAGRSGATAAGRTRRLAALTLAALALLLIGGLIGRATAPSAEGQARGEATEAPAVEGPGPSRVEAGVPVGYQRSEAGAAAAAAQYVTALDDGRGLDSDQRESVLAAIAAEDAREDLAASMAPGADLLIESFGLTADVLGDPGFVARSLVAGYRIDEYDADTATVAVWGTSIFFAEGRQALSDVWTTQTVTLRWERDDWRLVGLESDEGPTPPQSPTPADAGVGERINAFDRYANVPPPE